MNHNKYMVTEKSGYIGTSNWEADYFINTGGIGFAFTPEGAANRGGSIPKKQELCRVGKYLRYSIERYRRYSSFLYLICI